MVESVFVVGAVAVMFAAVYMAGRILIRMTRQERVHCYTRQEDFDAVIQRTAGPGWGAGRPTDITACSAFEEPSCITCEKSCLRDGGVPQAV